MLEILGFIALIAIIFGVSMTTAFGMVVNAVLWFIGICVAIAIVSKMQANTVKILAWIAIIAGGYLLTCMNSYQNSVTAPCFSLKPEIFGWEAYADCLSRADEAVGERNATMIWLFVIGAVLFVAAWVKNDGTSNNPGQNTINPNGNKERKPEGVDTKASTVKNTAINESQNIKVKMADIIQSLPSLKRKKNVGLWITGISFIIGPIMYLAVLFFLPDGLTEVIYSNSAIYYTIMTIAMINLFIFPFFLALTPYWIIKYRSAKKELEELKSTIKKSRKP